MGRLTAAAKDRALRALLGGPLYVGLATGVRGDRLVEESDAGYARQLVQMGEPRGDDEVRQAANDLRVDFPPYAADARADVRQWFLTTTPLGDGDVLAWGDLMPRFVERDGTPHYPRPVAGEAPFMMPGDIVVEMGDAEETL